MSGVAGGVGMPAGGGAQAWAEAHRAQETRRVNHRAAPADAAARRQVVAGFLRSRVSLGETLRLQYSGGSSAAERAPTPIRRRSPLALSGLAAMGALGGASWSDPGVRNALGVTASALTLLMPGQAWIKKFGQTAYSSSPAGTASTALQIIAWGDTAPGLMPFTDVEIRALTNAAGWAQTNVKNDDGSYANINLWDTRNAKLGANGHWVNRNTNADLGIVIATGSDPSHTVVGNITSTLADVAGDIVNFLGQAVRDLWAAIQALGADAEALIDLILWTLGLLPEVTNPGQLLNDLNPLTPGSKAYSLVMDPSKTRQVNLVSVILFAPFALGMLVTGELLNAVGVRLGPDAAFAPGPDGANLFTKFLRDLISGINASSGADRVKSLLQAFEDLLSVFTGGVEISPPGLIQVAILVLTNIPLPPVGSIIETLLADPLVQKSLSANGVPPQFADKALPIAMRCFQANSATEYLTCAQNVLELFFPGFITKMQNTFYTDVNDLRTVIAAMWASNGDLTVLLDDQKFPGVHQALVGIGVLGFAHMASTLGTDIDSALNSLKGVLPSDLLTALVTGEQFVLHVVNVADGSTKHGGGFSGARFGGVRLGEWRGMTGVAQRRVGLGLSLPQGAGQYVTAAQNAYSSTSAAATQAAVQSVTAAPLKTVAAVSSAPIPAVAKRALFHLQKSKWDVKRAVMSMRLDEFTDTPWAVADGGDGITQVKNVALFRFMKLRPDDPTSPITPEGQDLIDFLIKTFGAPIAHFLSDLVGGPANVPAAVAKAQTSDVPSGQQATVAAVRGAGAGLNKPSASGKGVSAQVKTTSPASFIAGAATGGGAGFIVGGPVGAAVGAIIGGLLANRGK